MADGHGDHDGPDTGPGGAWPVPGAVPANGSGGGPDPHEATSPTYLDERWFSGPAVTEGERDDVPEATLIRFGPGVPREPGQVPGERGSPRSPVRSAPGPRRGDAKGGRRPRGRRDGDTVRGGRWWLRRSWPVVVVLALVLGYLAWQRTDPGLAVTGVSVRTSADRLGCGQTATVRGTVRTNGGSGTLVYRWRRSDGTSSAPHRERVSHGRETVEVRLRWSFRGTGSSTARATLQLISPSTRSASTTFTYACR